uniref:Uncharacterized protein n=1 Tax=Candidatus Kentrum sp. MB TaxID=2138164 RepID=A0A450Y087_9GAMM|nr:MAG: hypothetical protein BECKMB1821G_GA0114241_10274 [Candidatus Kentron sp. MB]VFK34940.1 MAG: hypothetical protein BECKMB1821I_GA0114274_10924 [Candidatus Kentron sp. MB]VFK77076.1 MAG: hypothetical protein BECKMB1821H_GA0114242_10974 [Candidatus Kentron sp. MB]
MSTLSNLTGIQGRDATLAPSDPPRYDPWSDADSVIPSPLPGTRWPEGNHRATIPTLQEARRLLGPRSDSTRLAMQKLFHRQSLHASRSRLRLGQHDRGESYIFGGGDYCHRDQAGVNRHLPLHVKVVRLKRWRLKKGQILDLSAHHGDWPGLHFREELYVHIEIDHLEVEPGAVLEVHGNVLVIKCREVARIAPETQSHSTSAEPGPWLEIRILGTRHPAYGITRPSSAVDGKAGHAGGDGRDSSATEVVSTPFGARLAVDTEQSMDGQPGQHGGDGEDATSGMAGGMAMLAVLLLGELKGFPPGGVRIFAQAGAGRPGGHGGKGGNGGNGGDGADGLDGIDGPIPGGRGGAGGDGGNGGNGGHGGHGGLASNVFVQVSRASIPCIETVSLPSKGGAPGRGGAAGRGGCGGVHGKLAFPSPDTPEGQRGPDGGHGRAGRNGRPGRSRPAATIHLLNVSEK